MTTLEVVAALRFFSIADGVLLALCLLVGLLLRWVRRRLDPPPPGLDHSPLRTLVQGSLLAVGVLAATVIPAAVAGGYRAGPGWEAYPASGERFGPALTWLFFAVQALLEELVFRGVAMTVIATVLFALVRLVIRRRGEDRTAGPLLWTWLGAGLLANLVVSVAFGLVHADNPNATPVAVLNVVLISLLLGQLVWTRGSILGAWALHWVWNASVVTLGFPISGIRVPPPIAGFGVAGARDGLLTGGQFGPEGALPCTVALVVTLGALAWWSVRDVVATVDSAQDGWSGDAMSRSPESIDAVRSGSGTDRSQSETRPPV